MRLKILKARMDSDNHADLHSSGQGMSLFVVHVQEFRAARQNRKTFWQSYYR